MRKALKTFGVVTRTRMTAGKLSNHNSRETRAFSGSSIFRKWSTRIRSHASTIQRGYVRLLHYQFVACSAFTHVTTCRLPKSLYAALSPGGSDGFVVSPHRLLPGGAIQFRRGLFSRCGPVPFHGAPNAMSLGRSINLVWGTVLLAFGSAMLIFGLRKSNGQVSSTEDTSGCREKWFPEIEVSARLSLC